eukprot:scaffold84212_cov72-Cyclotella_meneghiniana.AAC.3
MPVANRREDEVWGTILGRNKNYGLLSLLSSHTSSATTKFNQFVARLFPNETDRTWWFLHASAFIREYLLVGATWGLYRTDPAIKDDSARSIRLSIATQTDLAGNEGEARLPTVKSFIPREFAIVRNDAFDGNKIVALKSFKRGEIIYYGECLLIDLSFVNNGHILQVFSYEDPQKLLAEYRNSDTHSVEDYGAESNQAETSRRQVYGWDSYMNHSCDPNAHFPLNARTEDKLTYYAIALRDISVGDEITCDYACFDYHCDGHEIEDCKCNAPTCRGKMLGFHGLSTKEKIRLLHLVDKDIKEQWLKDEEVTIFETTLPDGIDIRCNKDEHDYDMIAKVKFEVGDILFTNDAKIIEQGHVSDKVYILDVGGGSFFVQLNPSEHFIHRGDYCEMLGFDSFMNHSCSPNTHQRYHDQTKYSVIASKTILPGESVTCDYTKLGNDALGLESIVTSEFLCSCGSPNCKGIIKG